jgi:hypothetical protein
MQARNQTHTNDVATPPPPPQKKRNKQQRTELNRTLKWKRHDFVVARAAIPSLQYFNRRNSHLAIVSELKNFKF